MIVGDISNANQNVLLNFAAENKNATTLMISFADDAASLSRLEDLASKDDLYSNAYSWIGTIANPVITQTAFADGDDTKKRQLKAEALALRAYAHFMLLQKYAKAYHPATAATDPAIIYLTEGMDISVNYSKNTVKECYDKALADINAAIEDGSLPDTRVNACRMSKAAAQAVKAHILMAMQQYPEAESAAKQALSFNSTIYDYWKNTQSRVNTFGGAYTISYISSIDNPEIYMTIPGYISYLWMKPEAMDDMEDGYYSKELVNKFSFQNINLPEGEQSNDQKIGLPGWDGADLVSGSYDDFSGLTVPAMLLICAEAELRGGNIDNAMGYLDQLRKVRMNTETYTPLKGTVKAKGDAIMWMKRVSFEENAWNGWNYIQRKRWNVEPEWETILSRTVGGTTYTLSPKSNLWIFPFPKTVREINPYMTTNKNN